MKKKVIYITLIFLTIVLAAATFVLLPDELVIQVGFDGNPTNTVAKPIAILIPILLSTYGLYRSGKDGKGFLISAIAILLFILTFIFNI